MPTSRSVVVVGGGVIGLSCAWTLARRGRAVTVVDPDPGRGASWAAAGMLAPVTEAAYGEQELLALGLAAAARWPSFATELADASGQDPGLRDTGTLVLAHDSGDGAVLARFADFADRLGLPLQRLDRQQVRRLEPMLAPDVHSGLLSPDRSVHNRATVGALLTACERAGVQLVRQRATAVAADSSGHAVVVGDGTRLDAAAVVVATGVHLAALAGLPPEWLPPVRPVRGTILRLATPRDYRAAGGVLTRTLRGTVDGAEVYLVPREDGEIVIGATTDEVGFDDRPTAGGVWQLLRDARLLLPVVSELTFVEAWSGLRPVTPDHGPVVGETAAGGVIVAGGHGRGGMLLAPVTADAVAALVTDGAVTPELEPFPPSRFATRHHAGTPA